MQTRKKFWLATVAGSVVIVGGLAGVKAAQFGSMINAGKSFVPPPEAVSSAKVQQTAWQEATEAVGSIVAVQGVTLSAELPGVVREVSFESGSSVKRGQVLVRLDISTEQAQLDAAVAEETMARLAYERAKQLRQTESNSRADLESAQARQQATAATVAGLRATIAKKTLRAPFDGRISIRQVELGQVVAPGTPIASLQSVDPVYAEFYLPQQALARVTAGQPVRVHTDAFPDASWDGEVTTVNSEVDVATRSVRLRATLPNPDGRLRPGMFANVEVLARESKPVLAIPATAVVYAPYGDSVFVLESKPSPDGKPVTTARQQFVRLGEHRGELVAVRSGLSAQDTVVSSGAFKLRNGMPVTVNDSLAPKAESAPAD